MPAHLKRERSTKTTLQFLDASAYPHILETIFGFASTSVLITLRCTSRSFQQRADRELFRHIVFDLVRARPCGLPHVVAQASATTPHSEVITPPLVHLALLSPDGARLPGGDWGDRGASPRERARWASHLAHTRTLDYRAAAELAACDLHPQLAAALDNTRIVRRMVYTPRIVFAPTVIDYADFTRANPAFPTPRAHLARMPHGLGRWVLNVRVDAAHPPAECKVTMQGQQRGSAGGGGGACVPYGTHVVVVFSTATNPNNEHGGDERLLPPGAPPWGVLAPVLAMMSKHAPLPTRPYTLVGVTRLPRSLLGLCECVDEAELQSQIFATIVSQRDIDLGEYGRGDDDERYEAVHELVRFATPEQYTAEHGAGDWATVSEWPEMNATQSLVGCLSPELLSRYEP